MDDELQQLLAVFRVEAKEILDEMAAALDAVQDLEGTALQLTLESTMRKAHNLKGASAIVGAQDVETLAHALEDVLSAVKASGSIADTAAAELLLESVGLMQRLVDDAASGEEVEPLVARLAAFVAGAPTEGQPVAPSASGTAAGDREATESGRSREVRSAEGPTGGGVETVRVETARLDRLMGFIGELLVVDGRMAARTVRLERIAEDLRGRHREGAPGSHDGFWNVIAEELGAVAQLSRVDQRAFTALVGEISDSMKKVRMVPLLSQAPTWRRTARECARNVGKHVRVVVEVGEVELDRSVLDRLREPMIHLLRNAVDHGIEPADEREANNKPAPGKIVIRSNLEGAMVRLEVSDDGRGVDRERVVAAAVAKGLVDAGDAARMDAEEMLELTFEAGLSSAESVGHISGRGVGLDAVRKALNELGGRVEALARGELGGASFVLTFPVTLLSSRGLLVRAGDSVFALPIECVERSLRVETSDLGFVEGCPALTAEDGEPILVHWLGALMGCAHRPRGETLTVVLAARGRARLGLVVDEVLREDEYVIRKLPWNLKRVAGVGGAVILADGSLAVAVDPSFLFESARDTRARARPLIPAPSSGRLRVLVADDSLTSRTLERNVLTSAGYDVDLAVDGKEAWQMLHDRHFDLLVSDVDMPHVDGVELTRRVRGDSRLAHLPVILVTRLAEPSDVARGMEAGADEYIAKGEFEQDALLEAVSRLL